MPYTAWDQVNPAIKGIKPRLTLAMANHIAAMADAIAAGKNPPDSPWAVAIANFYREYKRSGGRWVKRKPKEAGSMEPKTKLTGEAADGNTDTALDKDMAETPPEAAKVAEGSWYPGGDECPPYVPGGAKSFADVEASQAAQEATARMHEVTYQFGQLAWNILNDDEETDKLGKLKGLTDEFLALAAEVMGAAAPEPTTPPATPPASVQPPAPPVPEAEVAEGFRNISRVIVDQSKGSTETPASEEVAEPSEGTAIIQAEMSEVAFGHALRLVEDDPAISPPVGGSIVPMAVDVAFIEPGWGNEHDKHYYPAEVLKRDAHVFEGAKMYETDHRQQEKSTRTWVSTISTISGFTETGAPVARVIVHDEDFAKRLKALSEAAMLEKMECSILALGEAKKGKVDGKEANIVERITEAQSVDWVTRAGAGGRALKLTEGESGMKGYRLTFKIKGEVKPANEAMLKALNGALGTVVEGAELADVVLAEVDEPVVAEPEADGEKPPVVVEPAAGEEKPPEDVTPPKDAVTPAEPEAAPALTAEAISAALEATNLPAVAKARLAAAGFTDQASLKAAIGQETEYVKALTGSGKPFAQGPSRGPDAGKAMTEAEYATAMDGILGRHGIPI